MELSNRKPERITSCPGEGTTLPSVVLQSKLPAAELVSTCVLTTPNAFCSSVVAAFPLWWRRSQLISRSLTFPVSRRCPGVPVSWVVSVSRNRRMIIDILPSRLPLSPPGQNLGIFAHCTKTRQTRLVPKSRNVDSWRCWNVSLGSVF